MSWPYGAGRLEKTLVVPFLFGDGENGSATPKGPPPGGTARRLARVVCPEARSYSPTFSASGLPSGLSIKSVAHSTNGLISGTVSAAPGTYNVTVTAKNGSANGVTHFQIVVH